MARPEAVKVGVPPKDRQAAGASIFYNVPADEAIEMKVLSEVDEIVSIEQCALWFIKPAPIWTYIGDDDPSHDLGIKPGYRAFLPIAIKVDGETQIKLWSMSIGSHRNIVEIADALGTIKGQLLRVKREGSGLTTKYKIIPLGRRVKITEAVPTVDEIIDLLGPYEREEIVKMIEEKAKRPFASVAKDSKKLAEEKAGKEKAGAPRRSGGGKAKSNFNDEELEELEEISLDEESE